MQIVNPDLTKQKRIILRFDIDVPIEQGRVVDDFRLKTGLPTLTLCLENASSVVMMGHVGRPASTSASLGGPAGKDLEFSVQPVYNWFIEQGFKPDFESGKLKLLENLRFEPGEEAGDLSYAKKLAEYGDFFVFEAFAAYRPAASTTVLPTLLPHAAGLQFAKEVEKINQVRENPEKPLVVIMGGAKVADKLPVITTLAQKADTVLVGGKLVAEIQDKKIDLPSNVMVAKMTTDGFDINEETVLAWESIIKEAKMIVWNGPLGKTEDPKNTATKKVAQLIIDSRADSIVGGGDTTGALQSWGMIDKFSFVSTGGGAMLKLLTDGTLPTIQALA
ncbi:MAG: phosphoglycerate kinase [Candidatus Daviesbacteria bacterium]|nr:phosphoglycerate kinase [Candidatus Daviesbacteria bacterium]